MILILGWINLILIIGLLIYVYFLHKRIDDIYVAADTSYVHFVEALTELSKNVTTLVERE